MNTLISVCLGILLMSVLVAHYSDTIDQAFYSDAAQRDAVAYIDGFESLSSAYRDYYSDNGAEPAFIEDLTSSYAFLPNSHFDNGANAWSYTQSEAGSYFCLSGAGSDYGETLFNRVSGMMGGGLTVSTSCGSYTDSNISGASNIALTYHLTSGDQVEPDKLDNVFAVVDATFLIDKDGSVWAAGDNTSGKLGVSSPGVTEEFEEVPSLSGLSDIDSGVNHSIALRHDGTVWVSGLNGNGQIGTSDTSSFVAVPGLSGIKAIAAGANHSFALRWDGRLFATGSNFVGQLGFNGTSMVSSFTDTGLTGVKAVAAYGNHSLIVMGDGTLMVAGDNSSFQLGVAGPAVTAGFQQVPDIENVKDVHTGAQHSVYRDALNDLYGSGSNASGQLGSGSSFSAFTQLPISNVMNYELGSYNTAVIDGFSQAFVTGESSNGELQASGDYYSFTKINSSSTIAKVSPGSSHTIAFLASGFAYVTGQNMSGQLGKVDTSPVFGFEEIHLEKD